MSSEARVSVPPPATPIAPGALPVRTGAAGRIAVILLGVLTLAWIAWAFAANLDAADGRHVLHMDEIITFDGISQLRDANDPKALTNAIVGPDQRYGRPTWYLPAIFAAPMGEIMGEPGQIVATRIFFAGALLASLFVFALALLDTWTWRAMAIAAAAVTPFAFYYATMPKPEPLLLLFLAAFLWLMVRRKQNLGLSWVFLGLAFGMKISVAPALVLLLVLAVLREWGFERIRLRGPIHFGVSLVTTVVAFLVGFIAAVPGVLDAKGRKEYVENTWLNTGHGGSDSSTVTPVDWFKLISENGFFGPGWLWLVAIAIMLAVLAVALAFSLLGPAGEGGFVGRLQTAARDRRVVSAAVFGVGAVMMLSIIVGVKRLWGFYLFPGAVMMLFGAFGMLEPMAQRNANLFVRSGALTVGAVLFTLAFVGGASGTVIGFRHEARRSHDATYQVQQARYKLMTSMAEHTHAQLGKPISVVFRARFWFPTSTADIRYDPLYGVHDIWAQSYELVFLEKEDDPANIGDPTQPYAQEVAKFISQRDDHLAAAADKPCKTQPCYVEVPSGLPGIYVWELASVIQPISASAVPAATPSAAAPSPTVAPSPTPAPAPSTTRSPVPTSAAAHAN